MRQKAVATPYYKVGDGLFFFSDLRAMLQSVSSSLQRNFFGMAIGKNMIGYYFIHLEKKSHKVKF